MKQKNLYALSLAELKGIFQKEFPVIYNMALHSESNQTFKSNIIKYINNHSNQNSNSINHLLRMIRYDGQRIYELSTQSEIRIDTIENLRKVFQDKIKEETAINLLTDLYFQFKNLEKRKNTKRNISIKEFMERWPSGLEEEIILRREKNKNRIIKLLIKRIENKTSHSLYHFPNELSDNEKENRVQNWWNESRFHLSMAIKNPKELNEFLGHSLSNETMETLTNAYKKKMPFFITPYYLSLLNPEKDGYDDSTIRSYILYSKELVDNYGNIRAWEREDSIESGKPNAAGWLLPEGNNIHRRYPDVAILIPDSMGRACGGLCASCQRMYDFQSKRLNFDLEELKPKESWEKKLSKLMEYFENDTQLRDILITGGDALMSQNKSLKKILEAVYLMALKKVTANRYRETHEKFATLQRVRLGSRLPAYLPMRIDPELIKILSEFREKASQIGIRQFIIQTHFQSPLEITPEAVKAVHALISAGWTITNQLVYNVAASRRGHTAKLRMELNKIGILCYYTFSVKGFNENQNVSVPNCRSIQEKEEEKIHGLLNPEQQIKLNNEIQNHPKNPNILKSFLRENKLLFAATDRNVLNLPGIGKSMTFETIGITIDGKRILKFSHDIQRKHSPIIEQMGDIFIVENKSVRNYLRQIKEMQENISDYESIWQYTEGETESRFLFYKYPSFEHPITKEISNLHIPLFQKTKNRYTQ